jgi:hypothetical protein
MRYYGFWILSFSVLTVSSASAQYSMPGVEVGKPYTIQPVGTRQPTVGTMQPRVGTAPPNLQQSRTFSDPFGLKGTGIQSSQLAFDPKNLSVPIPQVPGTEKDFWDRLYDRWLSIFESDPKPSTNWTPGIGRRNRDRKEDRFRRD